MCVKAVYFYINVATSEVDTRSEYDVIASGSSDQLVSFLRRLRTGKGVKDGGLIINWDNRVFPFVYVLAVCVCDGSWSKYDHT
jgi:hypothetical protein